MRYPVQKCRCHLGIAKDRHPFPKLQICCDVNAGLFIKPADEVEQQRPAGFRERDVSQLINDHTIHLGKLADDFTRISLGLFFDQGIYEIINIFSLWDVLLDQTIGVCVEAPLPGMVGMREEALSSQLVGDLFMVSELSAKVRTLS